MWWVFIACTLNSPVSNDSGHTQEDTGGIELAPTDLLPAAVWRSRETGVGTGIAWSDLDRDGFAELIVAYGNDIQRGPVVVYRNREGIVEEEASWTSGTTGYYGQISVGDVNGDGYPDLAASRFLGEAGFSSPGGVEVFLNQGGDLESLPSWVSSESFYSFSCSLGDMDRDGDLDLAVAVGEAYYHAEYPEPSRVYLNDGSGDFGELPGWSSAEAGHAFDVGWADMDGDGWLDLLLANQGAGHSVHYNQGGVLSMEPGWQAEGGEFEGNTLDWGDLNRDGSLDLVVTDNDQLGGPGTARAWCGPDLAPCWEAAVPVEFASAISLEDVDGNGWLDVAVGSWWGTARVFFNEEGVPDGEPGWESLEAIVIEAFDWEDIDGSDHVEAKVTGEGLIQIPGRGRVLEVVGGTASGGWASGPGALEVRYLESSFRDLAVSNWERESGNLIYGRK